MSDARGRRQRSKTALGVGTAFGPYTRYSVTIAIKTLRNCKFVRYKPVAGDLTNPGFAILEFWFWSESWLTRRTDLNHGWHGFTQRKKWNYARAIFATWRMDTGSFAFVSMCMTDPHLTDPYSSSSLVTWTDASGEIQANQNSVIFTIPAPSGSQSFYRVYRVK
jgi:hypothetical protein